MMNTEEIECPVCGEMVNINILEYKLYGGGLDLDIMPSEVQRSAICQIISKM